MQQRSKQLVESGKLANAKLAMPPKADVRIASLWHAILSNNAPCTQKLPNNRLRVSRAANPGNSQLAGDDSRKEASGCH